MESPPGNESRKGLIKDNGRVYHPPHIFNLFMKRLTFFFTLFIIAIIVLADRGILSHYLGFIYDFPYGDKAGHFILYGILTFLINLTTFEARPDQNRKLLAIKLGLILALLIGLEEFSQRFFVDRTFSLLDLSFSYLGVIVFSWLALKIKSRTRP
jgi:hypothetical protein